MYVQWWMLLFLWPLMIIDGMVAAACWAVRRVIRRESWVHVAAILFMLIVPSVCQATEGMKQVNAVRARFGLPPFIEDAELSRFAVYKATWQATHDIGLHNSQNGHEGMTVPGMTEGTGVIGPRSEFTSCAFLAKGQHRAGAAVVRGPSGERWCCLVIDAPRITDAVSNPVVKTLNYMPANDAVVTEFSPVKVKPEPAGSWYSKPTSYPEWDYPVPIRR